MIFTRHTYKLLQNFMRQYSHAKYNIQVNPVFYKGSLFVLGPDFRFISFNAASGKINCELCTFSVTVSISLTDVQLIYFNVAKTNIINRETWFYSTRDFPNEVHIKLRRAERETPQESESLWDHRSPSSVIGF